MFIKDSSLIKRSINERESPKDFYILKIDFEQFHKDSKFILDTLGKDFILKESNTLVNGPNGIPESEFKLQLPVIDKLLQKELPGINIHRKQLLAVNLYNYIAGIFKATKDFQPFKAESEFLAFTAFIKYNFSQELSKPLAKTVDKLLFLEKSASYNPYTNTISKTGVQYEPIWITLLSSAGFDIVFVENVSVDFDLDSLNGNTETPLTINIEGELTLKKLLDKTAIDIEKADNAGYCRFLIKGGDNRNIYIETLHDFYKKLQSKENKIIIVDNTIPLPTTVEIAEIHRQQYKNVNQMIAHLSNGIIHQSSDIRGKLISAFTDVALSIYKKENNLSKTLTRLVYLLCWIRKYISDILDGKNISIFIYFGTVETANESCFLDFMSKLPIHIINFQPKISVDSSVSDKYKTFVFEEEPVNVKAFPREKTVIGTVAYNAERDLDHLLYENTGVYRPNQFKTANCNILNTTYDEIRILWNQELKFRPGFNDNGTLSIPVIFTKVNGIKNNDIQAYWKFIQELMSADMGICAGDCSIYRKIFSAGPKLSCAKFFSKNKLNRELLKSTSGFKWAILNENMQSHLLDKLEELLKSNCVKGMGTNGFEYDIIQMLAFDMPDKLLQRIQSFDFTQKNPKLIYIICNDKPLLAEDAALASFCSLIGFDVVFFVPSGYRLIEPAFNKIQFTEHQLGNFKFGLTIPDLNNKHEGSSWLNRLFGRG